jgi:hypothetical protein
MGRERFHFLPFPRPVGPPFGILTYPDGRVGVIHPSAWRGCMKSPQTRTSRLVMRRIIAAYTNASPLAQSLS